MSGGANQSPTPAEIVAALERTGFLLEHRAAQKLENAGFLTLINEPFPDPDTGTSRETDLYGMIEYEVNFNITVAAHVLVECKNYSPPLVIIGKRNTHPSFPVDTTYVSFDPLKLFFPRRQYDILSQLKLQDACPDDQIGQFTGYQLVRMDRKSGNWVADNSSIYDSALYPLVKARQHEINKNDFNRSDHDQWEYPAIIYYFPVLLTAGEVFTVTIQENANPKVARAKWANLSRQFHARDLQTTLRVDIVSFEHFSEYLSCRVMKTAKGAQGVMATNLHLYDPEWLRSKYGLPRESEIFNEWSEVMRAKGP